MHEHHHHHIPRPAAGPFDGSRRRGFRDPLAGPGQRGGRGRFGDRGTFGPDGPSFDSRGDLGPEGGPADFGLGRAGGPGFPPGFDRRLGPDFGPGFGPGFGPQGGRGRGRGHGRRAGRGDIRAAILLLLAEQPRHGYELIKEIGERTDGAWVPSPGAIYPALSLLEDEGLVTVSAESGRKLAALSEAGRAYVTAHADELGDPFAEATARTPKSRWALRDAVRGLMGASMQVAQNGDEAQVSRALVVLDTARKDLYRILAGDQPAGGAATSPSSEPTEPTEPPEPSDDEPEV